MMTVESHKENMKIETIEPKEDMPSMEELLNILLDVNMSQSQLKEIKTSLNEKAAQLVQNFKNQGDSDLDVVIEYKGDIREDVFFDMLHEDGLSVGGMKLDINPITEEKSGTLEDFLAQANQRLEEKGALKEIYLTFYAAECAEFHNMGEYRENLTLEDAAMVYESISANRMNGIKALGFVLHDPKDSMQDMCMDILSGNVIDVDTICCVPEFRDSLLVQQAIYDVIKKFPEAEVRKREPSLSIMEKLERVKMQLAEESPKSAVNHKTRKEEERSGYGEVI